MRPQNIYDLHTYAYVHMYGNLVNMQSVYTCTHAIGACVYVSVLDSGTLPAGLQNLSLSLCEIDVHACIYQYICS
jgi:hypothetical protein